MENSEFPAKDEVAEESLTKEGQAFFKIFNHLMTLPSMNISREEFLKDQFGNLKNIDEIIKLGPVKAGISGTYIKKLAKGVAKYHSNTAAALSFVSGLPGGLGIPVAIAGDMGQIAYHFIKGMQKMSYLYGANFDRCTDEQKNSLFLAMFYIMLGGSFVSEGSKAFAVYGRLLQETVKHPMTYIPFMKAPIHKFVNKVVQMLLLRSLSRGDVIKLLGRVIPVLSGLFCGTITKITSDKAFNNLIEYFESEIKK